MLATHALADTQMPAELIWSIHQPWRANVGDCLTRWRALDPRWRRQSYLVLHGEAGARRTLGAAEIAVLAAEHAGRATMERRAAIPAPPPPLARGRTSPPHPSPALAGEVAAAG